MADLPTVLTSAGLQTQSPASLLAQLLALVAATNPGYTANLPGSLIEDISSTDVGALTLIDQARVELVNSLTPFGANAFLLNQLGQMYGIGSIGAASNTSVFVIFSGTPGFPIAKGFTVSDGTYQYIVQDGGIINSDEVTSQLFCLASIPGTWAVPPNSVSQLITSVPSSITLSCSNPTAGVPGGAAQTESEYRSQVLQAGLAAAQGFATMLKTLLGEVSGVQARLVSILQQAGGGWEVIVGGGDPYEVAYAIYTALFDVSTLTGSVLAITNITSANPGVVTVDLNHGYTTGQVVKMIGIVGPITLNNASLTITVVNEKTFSIGVNTSILPSYVSGGEVTPNLRNIVVNIQDYPDIYSIPYVNPPQQVVAVTATWNTSSPNFVSQASVSQLATPAIIDYINSIPVGQPINLIQLDTAFQESIADILAPSLLTRLVFSISINGIGTPPTSGTKIIVGDPESYFETSTASVTVSQG